MWFALNEQRPLFAFAGIWTTFSGGRGTKSKPVLPAVPESDRSDSRSGRKPQNQFGLFALVGEVNAALQNARFIDGIRIRGT